MSHYNDTRNSSTRGQAIASGARKWHHANRSPSSGVRPKWMTRKSHNRTHASQGFTAVSFAYLSVEFPFYKFYGINLRPKLDVKRLDRFFHWRRQVSPPVNNLTHRFLDGSQHFRYCNFTISFRHSAVAVS